MTDTTRTSDDLWNEEGEEDDEQTQVAMNPLHRSSEAPASDLSRSHARSLSSFGSPRSSWPPGTSEHGRPSLYERLVRTGALDDGLPVDAKHESSRPLSQELQRSGSHELPPPPDLRDLAEALEGSDGRDSAEALRDSDLQMVAPTSQIDTKPLRPLPTAPGQGPRALPPLPRPNGNGQVPSMLLGPGASMRNDATERFSHMPSTHPLANSIAPTAPSIRPAEAAEKRTPTWLVAAAALMLVGAGAAIGRFRSAAPASEIPERTAAAAAPIAAQEPVRAEPVAKSEPALPAPEAPAPIAPEASASAVTSPADEAEVAETPAEERKRERELRRALRESEAAAAQPLAAAAPAVSDAPVVATTPARVRPAAPAGPLTAQPSREQVVATMDAMLPELARCVGEKHGATTVTMTVRSTGVVSYALVGGSFAGTAEGSCIARVIKLAKFPAFTDPSIRVAYPFQL